MKKGLKNHFMFFVKILVPKQDALDNFNQNDEITVKRHVLVADETRNGSFYNLLGEVRLQLSGY